MRHEVKQFVKELKRRGWYIHRKAGTGHLIMYYPPGGMKTVPLTPSDRNWIKNAWEDVRRVEREYGPYVPVKKEAPCLDRGRNYQVSTEKEIEERVQNDPPLPREELVLTPVPAEVPVPILRMSPTLSTVEPRSVVMSAVPNHNVDRDIIIKALEDSVERLRKELEAHPKFIEYTKTVRTLEEYKKALRSDEEKINDFLEQRDSLEETSHNVVRKRKRMDVTSLYTLVTQMVVDKDGEDSLEEICSRLTSEHGYVLGFPNSRVSAKSHLVEIIRDFNARNPDKVEIICGPIAPPGVKIASYTHVFHKAVEHEKVRT